MNAEKLLEIIKTSGIHYFTGVPDSQLSAFTDAVVSSCGTDSAMHTVAVNEGCAVGMAAGYHLATGKTACVYMQNSGLGNAVNPITSLLHTDVYSIGCLFVIGYRGEPNTHDEPQHIFMGKITLPLLDLLGIKYLVLEEDTDVCEFEKEFKRLAERLKGGESIALVVKKNSLKAGNKPVYSNNYSVCRESVIEEIVSLVKPDDVIVSTTGKISRELYEARKRLGKTGADFLTVGSMGHCSSIGLGLAMQKPNKRVIVLDGDGAMLMHMGAMATVARLSPQRFLHIVLDNSAHETVGGMPTGSEKIDMCKIASDCGYKTVQGLFAEDDISKINQKLRQIIDKDGDGPTFVRIPVALGSRSDLGRPKEKAVENKLSFMKNLN